MLLGCVRTRRLRLRGGNLAVAAVPRAPTTVTLTATATATTSSAKGELVATRLFVMTTSTPTAMAENVAVIFPFSPYFPVQFVGLFDFFFLHALRLHAGMEHALRIFLLLHALHGGVFGAVLL
jgi:hypothetical protein